MSYCENCGAELEKGTKFCEECGERQENDVQETLEVAKEHTPKKQSKNLIFIGLFLTIFVLGGICAVVLVNMKSREKQTNLKSKEKYTEAGVQPDKEEALEAGVQPDKEEALEAGAQPNEETTEEPLREIESAKNADTNTVVEGSYWEGTKSPTGAMYYINISNCTSQGFDFEIFGRDSLDGQFDTVFKHHTAVYTSDNTAAYYGQKYTLLFQWEEQGYLSVDGFPERISSNDVLYNSDYLGGY